MRLNIGFIGIGGQRFGEFQEIDIISSGVIADRQFGRTQDWRVLFADQHAHGYPRAILLLQKYGAAKLSGVDPANYKALLKDVEGLDHA